MDVEPENKHLDKDTGAAHVVSRFHSVAIKVTHVVAQDHAMHFYDYKIYPPTLV
jgi:hypothetical protein